jgi:RNA polymerase sigma factor (TIGR02999 family)
MTDADITQLAERAGGGDPDAAARLLPLVYDELRRLAAEKMARERAGHTLGATALVHEAYLRLAGGAAEAQDRPWAGGRRHFFAAAAEAMRRILVESARRRRSAKRGGGQVRVDLDALDLADREPSDEVLALSEALDRFAHVDPHATELVKIRYFAGLTLPEAAAALAISPRTADRLWAYARAWLHGELSRDEQPPL